MIFYLAWANLRRHRRRAFLTMLGITVSIGAYFTSAYYFTHLVERLPLQEVSLPADILVVFRTNEAAQQVLGTLEGVAHAEPVGVLYAHTGSGPLEVLARSSGSLLMPPGPLVAGTFPQQRDEVVLPVDMARAMGVELDGSTRFLFRRGRRQAWVEYRVVGLYDPAFVRFALPVISLEATGPLEAFAHLVHYLVLDDPAGTDELGRALLRDRDRVRWLETERLIQETEAFQAWREHHGRAQSSARGLVLVLLVISGLGVLNTVLLGLYQRRRELGILKALGMRDTQLFWLFLLEGALLGLGGLVLALGGTWLTLTLLTRLGMLPVLGLDGAMVRNAVLAALAVSVLPALVPASLARDRSAQELLTAG
jgi:ABC-type antimicrobial peptide transport system permease subunit